MEVKILGKGMDIEEKFILESPEEVRKQIKEYLSGKRIVFDLRIKWNELKFKDILEEMYKIPFGETTTYQDLGRNVGKHQRVVGMACAFNPIPLIIPCHRVLAKNGLGGFSSGLDVKKFLLEKEGKQLKHI